MMGWLRRDPAGALSDAPLSRKRKFIALAVAGATDLCQIVLFPFFWEGGASPFDWVLDLFTVVALTLILGFKWRLTLALLLELVPGLDLFPTWTALVLSLPAAPRAGGGGAAPRELNSDAS